MVIMIVFIHNNNNNNNNQNLYSTVYNLIWYTVTYCIHISISVAYY